MKSMYLFKIYFRKLFSIEFYSTRDKQGINNELGGSVGEHLSRTRTVPGSKLDNTVAVTCYTRVLCSASRLARSHYSNEPTAFMARVDLVGQGWPHRPGSIYLFFIFVKLGRSVQRDAAAQQAGGRDRGHR